MPTERLLFSENLCVSDGTEDDSSLNLTSGAAGSFDLASGEVDYAQNIFNKMYPASITKSHDGSCDFEKTAAWMKP